MANEKRANVPWNMFRDEVAKYFSDEIMRGKIARHSIDDHYKGQWEDLVEAAERAIACTKPRPVFSKVRRSVSKN